MAEITAKMVMSLRAKTDAPMMDCKKALVESEGNMDKELKRYLGFGLVIKHQRQLAGLLPKV